MTRAQLMNKGILFAKSILWIGFCYFHGQDSKCAESHGIPVPAAQISGEKEPFRGRLAGILPPSLPIAIKDRELASLSFNSLCTQIKTSLLGHIKVISFLKSVFLCLGLEDENAENLVLLPQIYVLVKYMIIAVYSIFNNLI